MLRSYLISAFRNLVAHKLYSAINVLGLTIGLTCFILVGLFVRNELRYDRHWRHADEIWRITVEYWNSKGTPGFHLPGSPLELGPALQLDFPEIEHVGRIAHRCSRVSREDVAFIVDHCMLADPGILDIFDFEFVRGDPDGALDEPLTAILTETLARKYFGDDDPIGLTLRIENKADVRVVGVIRDLPDTTHLAIDLLVSLSTLYHVVPRESFAPWEDLPVLTYIRLPTDYDIQRLTSQLPDFIDRHVYQDASEWFQYHPQRVKDIHLRSGLPGLKASGSLTTVYASSAVATFVLLIACINFMNLSSVRSIQRAREVGVRKAMGAERSQLVVQFLGEAFLLCSISVLLSVALVEALLPAFSTFVRADLEFGYLTDPVVAGSLVALVGVVGLVSGSYSALFLSGLAPARVLRGEATRDRRGAYFRRGLVIFQFAISIALMIATGVVDAQIRYASSIDLGFRKERTVFVVGPLEGRFGPNTRALRDEWLRNPEVLSVTASYSLPGYRNYDTLYVRVEGTSSEVGHSGGDTPASGLGLPFAFVDFNFLDAYGIGIVAGRGFSEDFPGDKVTLLDEETGRSGGGFILSELAAKQLGLTPEQAIGKGLALMDYAPVRTLARGTIVGVARDLRFASARDEVQPVLYMVPPDELWGNPTLLVASIRVTGNRLEETLEYIDATFRDFFPGEIIQRRFLDESFEWLYRSEKQQRELLMYCSLLAIVIASMGLYGLASFTAAQRTKEIGIRKVMGATIWDVVRLVTWDFTKLVLFANAIAWPVAYFATRRWLSGFAYRIDPDPWVFLGAGTAALLLAWLTVSGIAARVANTRPVLALRYE